MTWFYFALLMVVFLLGVFVGVFGFAWFLNSAYKIPFVDPGEESMFDGGFQADEDLR